MIINNNQIYKGDCLELIKSIPDHSIDLIVTDPPYVLCGSNSIHNNLGKTFSGCAKEIAPISNGFDLKLLDEWVRVMKDINIYIWCSKAQLMDYFHYFIDKLGCNFEILVWYKPNCIPFANTAYLKDKEYCLYFWKNKNLNIKYDRGHTVFSHIANVEDKKLYGHPTIKPLYIIENLIYNSSKPGDVVLDTFLGSGTTAVAAKNLGRQYIGFEIDDKYFKLAQDRLNNITLEERASGYKQGGLFDE